MKIKYSALLFLLVFLLGCGNSNKKEDLTVQYEEEDLSELIVSDEAMNEVIQNIASPIEVASLLNYLEVPFSVSYLSDPGKMSNHASSFEMAYNLGALSSDLGYLNMYSKTGSSINYLSTINKLADALEVGQFFDFVLMKRLATSDNTLDSLMFVSMSSFNRMDDFLRLTERSNLSSLMVAGVWIEGLYLATQVVDKANHADIRNMIGEQKLILNDILIIMQAYESDEKFAGILEDYKEIKKQYDNVSISYQIGEPETIEIDGMLMVVQNESSTITMSDETLSQIIEVTERIRNKHLNI